jgi:hypothetical protein
MRRESMISDTKKRAHNHLKGGKLVRTTGCSRFRIVSGFTILRTVLLILGLFVLPLNTRIHAQQSPLTAEQQVQEGNRYRSEKQYDKAVDSYRLAI